MNQSWKDKKYTIESLIRLISEHYGGDDSEWLNDYCSEIIIKYKSNLDLPLRCFESIKNNLIRDSRIANG